MYVQYTHNTFLAHLYFSRFLQASRSTIIFLSLLSGFPINKLQARVLHLHCFDYDRFSRDDSIGEIHLPLCQVSQIGYSRGG